MDLKIKVCHFTTVHPIDDVRIFTKECVSLANNGFDVTLIACGDIAFEDIKNGVKRISLNVPVKNRLQRYFKRSKAVYRKALVVDADIYHFHDPELLPIGLKLKRREKKVIFDSHEFYGEQINHKGYIPYILRTLTSAIYKKYEAFVCRRIDAVIQICTLNGEDYFERRAKKTIFITNTPLLQKMETKNVNSNISKDFVVHIGSLNYSRGITHIIKASALANVPLILVGNFSSEKYKKELELLDEYSNVHYKGYVNQEHIKKFFDESFAGLSTLLNVGQYPMIDTFPTKVYDYMSAGLPVIISETSFAKHMIEKYKMGLLVDPNNINDIANAILFLKNNKEIAMQMGENGRKAYKNEFNWQIEEKKLIELYKSL